MDMSGEHEIAAPRETVWAALNDPEVLKACIPGCQDIEKTSDTDFAAKVKAKVGPVNATFSGNVTLSNINPPASYTISGEGSGGAAGFAKGGADVALADEGESTRLTYNVHAQVGGKLAQLGQRLIQSTANKYAKQFFDNFKAHVEGPEEAEESSGATETSAYEPAASAAAAEPSAAPAAGDAPASAETPAASEPAPASPASATPAAAESRSGRLPQAVWIGGVIALVLVLLLIFGL